TFPERRAACSCGRHGAALDQRRAAGRDQRHGSEAEAFPKARRRRRGRGRDQPVTTRTPRLGFRVLGKTTNRRRPVDAGAALAAYAACDPRAEVERESYLSAFWFADDFRLHLEATGSSKSYNGVCWAPSVWWDIDHPDDPERALSDARRLA